MLNAIYAIARPSGTRVDLSVKTVEVRSMHFSPHSSLILLVFSVMKLFSKYSNMCDHDTSTSQTGGQTETDDLIS